MLTYIYHFLCSAIVATSANSSSVASFNCAAPYETSQYGHLSVVGTAGPVISLYLEGFLIPQEYIFSLRTTFASLPLLVLL